MSRPTPPPTASVPPPAPPKAAPRPAGATGDGGGRPAGGHRGVPGERVLRAPRRAVRLSADQPPEALGRALLDAGCGPRRVTVCAHLGHDDEAVSRTDLAGLAGGSYPGLSVVVLEAPGPLDGRGAATAGGSGGATSAGQPSLAWGLP